jgi:cell cycle sensor histidine kinase DivJ
MRRVASTNRPLFVNRSFTMPTEVGPFGGPERLKGGRFSLALRRRVRASLTSPERRHTAPGVSDLSMNGFADLFSTFVHPDRRGHVREARWHASFIGSRLIAGLVPLAALPAYVALRAAPSLVEVGLILSLSLPLAAALFLSRTGRLDIATFISALSLVGAVIFTAALTGGTSSPALVWLMLAPLEALASRSRRMVVAVALAAALGALIVALIDAWGLIGPARTPAIYAMPLFLAGALAYGTALALSFAARGGEERLRLEAVEARHHALVAHLGDLVTRHDSRGACREASPAAGRLIGVGPGELIDHGLLNRVHVADRPAFLKALDDVAATGRPASLVVRVRAEPHERATGEASVPHFVSFELRAFRVETQGEMGDEPLREVVAILRDVTERQRQEEEVEAARALAEQASIAKTRFLATVSHELRTPLNAIIGFSEMLSNPELCPADPERRREYAGIVHTSGNHLLEVVNAVLDISKIESGSFDLRRESFDLPGLIRACVDMLRLKASAGGVMLDLDLPEGLPPVEADRRAVRQIAINLISNAVKFTPEGGRVAVSVARRDACLEIAVEDTGIGIAADDLPRLGDPFFQARSSYDRTFEGTGLGLSVVRGLVGLHGGALEIESGPAAGTRVVVRLPLTPPARATGGELFHLPRIGVRARPARGETAGSVAA